MSDLSDTTGAITGIVGLGITLGALGLTLNFAEKASRGFQEPRPTKKMKYHNNAYDYDLSFGYGSKKKARTKDIYDYSDWGF